MNSTPAVAPTQALRAYLKRLWPDGVREDSYLVASGGPATTLRSRSIEEFVAEFPRWEAYCAAIGIKNFTGGWIGLAQVSRSIDSREPSARGGLAEVTALSCLWLDIDLAEGTKSKGASRAALVAVIEQLGEVSLAPSMVVASGPHGAHLYWVLREPLDLSGDERAEGLARHAEVQEYLYRVVVGMLCEADGRSVVVDHIIDATRVLRPAGGTNRKPAYGPGGFQVSVTADSGVSYNLSEIEERLTLIDSVPTADGGMHLGRMSAHPKIPAGTPSRSIFGDGAELPREAPAYFFELQNLVPELRLRVVRQGDRPWIAKLGIECPLCSSPSSPQRPGDSYIILRSGTYKCHHASCISHNGLAFSKWVQRDEFGIPRANQLALIRARTTIPKAISLVPEGAVRCTREEVGLEILKTLSESAVGKVCVMSIPTGAGKTRALAMISAHAPDIAIFFENYERIDEFIAVREAYIAERGLVDVPEIKVRKGVMRACAYVEEIKYMGAERNIRSEVCGQCDLRSTCAAHVRAQRGEVLIAPHASHASLRNDGMLRGRVVVFDEAPIEFTTQRFTFDDLAQSFSGSGAAKRVDDARAIMRVARQCMEVLAQCSERWHIAGRDRHGLHISHDDLRGIFVSGADINLDELLRALLWLDIARSRRTAGGAPDPMFQRITLDELRTSKRSKRKVAHSRAIEELWDGLVPAIMAHTVESADQVDVLRDRNGELSAYVDGQGRANFELRRRRALAVTRDDPTAELDRGCVILSATGSLHVERIRALNRACRVQLVGIDVVGDAPHMRVHVVAEHTARKDLVTPSGHLRRPERPEVWAKSLSSIAAALDLVREKHGIEAASTLADRVGVLTYMVVRQRLEGDEGWAAAQEVAGVRVRVHGHYGLDDVGSNEYLRQDVRMLLTLGHPTWHLGSIRADAQFLRLDPEELSETMAAERLAQSEGRLRAGWERDGVSVLTVHVHAAPQPPAHWQPGTYVTAVPANGRPQGRARVAVSHCLPTEPVSIADKARVREIIRAAAGGAPIRTKAHISEEGRGSLQCASVRIGGPDPTPAEEKYLTRTLLAAGWIRHDGVRSYPTRGRASTFAPPDWSREQVEAWACERLALLRAEGAG